MAGMERGSGTRSGLLWEVERLLKECNELPQVLLMENVPQVHGKKNKASFDEWCQFLESLGYKNYWKDLNAKDYGVPQNRNRCFMVSLLGDYSYEFPEPIELKLKLQDLLEDEVDERYYISDKMIAYLDKKVEQGWKKTVINNTEIANTICNPARNQINDNWIADKEIKLNQVAQITDKGFTEMTGRVYDSNGLSPTIQTMQGGNRQPKIQVVGGVGEKRSNNGTQYFMQDRIYEGDIANAVCTCANPYYKLNENIENKLDIRNIFFAIFDLCGIINAEESEKYERSRKLLSILWNEIGEKEIWEQIRGLWSFQKKEILQQAVYENGIFENREFQSKISSCPSNCKEYIQNDSSSRSLLDMWENWKTGYTPQRWELSEQQFRKFNIFMSQLSSEATSKKTSMQNMWQTNERIGILRKTLSEIQEIWRPIENKVQYRIRKLTPTECLRLQGVRDKYIKKMTFKKEIVYLEGGTKCNAKLRIVKEKQRHLDTETYVLCTTNDILDMEMSTQTKWKKNIKEEKLENLQNVNFVIELLEEAGHLECVTNIIKCGENTEMLYSLMKELDLHHTAIIELVEKDNKNIGKFMKILLEENFPKTKLFIISTLIEQIIKSKIYTCIVQSANIQGNIAIIENCVKNSKIMKLLNLKMEYITRLNSDAMLYKQAGNGIVVDVLMAIFKQML